MLFTIIKRWIQSASKHNIYQYNMRNKLIYNKIYYKVFFYLTQKV